MSAISSGQGLSAYFQNLSVNAPSSTPAATSADATNDVSALVSTGAATTSPTSATQTQGAGGHHRHHGGHGGGEAISKIQDAVTSALQTAQSNGSSSTDPNTIVEDAIAKVLQQNGGAPPANAGTPPTNPPGTAGSDPAGATGTAGSANQAFFQTLKAAGIDPQQFRADFLAAVKDAQNGQVNPSTALQSIPPGTAIDTTA